MSNPNDAPTTPNPIGPLPPLPKMRTLLAALALACFAGVALADEPPKPKAPACDHACVLDYCEARCTGPHRNRLTGRVDCRRACVEYVTANGCWPCKGEKAPSNP